MFISIRNADPTTIEPPPLDADIDKQFRAEKYFDITKSSIYNGKSILELEGFLRKCENVFFVRPTTYREHKFKIAFAVPLLSAHSSGSHSK